MSDEGGIISRIEENRIRFLYITLLLTERHIESRVSCTAGFII